MAFQPLPYQHGLHRAPTRVQGHRAHFKQPLDRVNNNKTHGRLRATTNSGGVRIAACTTPTLQQGSVAHVGAQETHSIFFSQHNTNQRAKEKEKAKAAKEKAKESRNPKRVPQQPTNFIQKLAPLSGTHKDGSTVRGKPTILPRSHPSTSTMWN